MKSYFKNLIFYSLDMLSAMVNTVCAIFRWYPNMQLGLDFLALIEFNRVADELEKHISKKDEELNKANTLMVEANEMIDARD